MESDLQYHHHFLHDNQLQHRQKQLNTGLTRHESAPSSFFSSFLDRDAFEDFLNRPPSPETERIFERFLSNAAGNTENNNVPDQKIIRFDEQSQLMQLQQQQQQQPQQHKTQPQQQQHNLQNQTTGSDNKAMNKVGMERFSQPMNMSGGNNSNLIRHSSSPAGLFNNITIENGCVVMKGMGDYGGGNNTIKREASYASSGRPPIASKPMSPIGVTEKKTCNANARFNESHNSSFSAGFAMDSWDDSSMMTENINRLREDDRTLSGLSAAETQDIDPGSRPPPPPPLLAHHLSLPKDISTIEKLLQYQDIVPCKIRAKRGCATHPRSIAERVRRTKISQRMRKLQELVPNMDQQTNTADMLDLAVDYVKELQKQVKALSDDRAKCTCANAKQEQP